MALLIVGAAAAWSAAAARADEVRPALGPVTVERGADGSARVEFQASQLFDQAARDAIESGVTATVDVVWEVEHPRTLWFNEVLDHDRETRTLRYDNLTKRYHIDSVPPRDDGQRETSSFEDAERWLGAVDAPVRADLSSGGEKLVRVRLSCDSRDGTLPLGFEKLLFFLPGWGFDTGWVSLALP